MTEGWVSLPDAVDRLAEVTGCPVAIEDQEYRVVAYSSVPGQSSDPVRDAAILRRRTSDEWLKWAAEAGSGDVLHRSDEPLMVMEPFPGLKRRQIKKMHHNGATVGYIWILEGVRGFPENLREEIAKFEHDSISEIARVSGAESYSTESHLVRSFLSGALPAAELGPIVGVGPEWLVVATLFASADPGYGAHKGYRDIGSATRVQYPAGRGRVVQCGVVERGLCRLDFFESTVDVPRHVGGMVRSARAVGRSLAGSLHVGMGGVHSLADGCTSWTEACVVVDFLRFQGQADVFAEFKDVRSRAALLSVRKFMDENPHLFGEIIPDLREGNANDSHVYVKTLKQYLIDNRSISRSASHLHLHPNSMRYRLERIKKALPWDLDDPREELMVRLGTLAPESWPKVGTNLLD